MICSAQPPRDEIHPRAEMIKVMFWAAKLGPEDVEAVTGGKVTSALPNSPQETNERLPPPHKPRRIPRARLGEVHPRQTCDRKRPRHRQHAVSIRLYENEVVIAAPELQRVHWRRRQLSPTIHAVLLRQPRRLEKLQQIRERIQPPFRNPAPQHLLRRSRPTMRRFIANSRQLSLDLPPFAFRYKGRRF
jgi:hypothetical protein